MSKKCFILISIFLVVGLASIASATNYYVRPNGGSYGSEDGSDWSNAFDGFSDVVWGSSAGQVGAGDTLYVAGGNYTSSINPTASGTSDSVRIVIRRATVAEHGTGTGWNSSFDAQVNLQPGAYVRIYGQSYITVDGVTEYGIYVDSPTGTNAYGIYVNNADYVTVQYIKTDGTNNGNDFRGMYWMNSSNTKVRHCHFNDSPNDALLMISIADSVIEYCILGPRITSSGGAHADGIEIRATENITFRYNEVNWQGDQVHFGIVSGVTDGWDIHGNVFRGSYSSGTAVKTNSVNPSVTNISIYNNVFYNLYRSITSQSNTSGVAKNNILYNVQKVTYDFGTYSHDYNYFKDATGDEEPPEEAHSVIGGDPFVDSANLDFHLDSESTAIDAGTNVGSTYNTDPDGNTRGADGYWDIGAYEYVSGAPDTTAPSPDPMTWATDPYATGSTSISMTATTATDTSGVEYYFDCTAGGGNDSGWQDSTTYQDTGLSPSTQYSYQVKARDKSSNQNETAYSTLKSATTQAAPDTTPPSPDPMTWATEPYATGTSSVSMTAGTATDVSGVEYYFECTAGGGNSSSWQDSTTYQDTGLDPNTQYSYRVKARDKSTNQNETAYSTVKSATTDAESTGAFQQDSGSQGIVSMEAENYDANTDQGSDSWVFLTTTSGYSGDGYMRAEPDNGTQVDTGYSTNSPQLDFEVNFVKTGTHYIWVRCYKTLGTDDSCHAGLDEQEISTCDRIQESDANVWHWTSDTMDSARATFNVSSTGVKTVNIWMREDGFRLDKVVLTVDAEYVPSGTGPAESSRGGEDTTAPSPDPMTWATEPYAVSSSSISMAATTATDASGVEYYFDCTTAGGHDSSWQDSTSYTDTGLSPSTQYSYQVKARDKSSNQNETAYSTLKSATTQSAPDTTAPSPDPMTWATEPYATGASSISMTATTATDASGVEYYFECTAGGGHSSSWQDSTTYEDTGLSELTQYTYRVKARDKSGNQNETAYSTTKSATTQDGTAPSPDPMTWATEPYAVSSSSISMAATTATDASGVEYYFDCTTAGGHDSSWQDSTSYTDTGLSPSTQYSYQVKARDKSSNQNETAYSTVKSATTQAPPDTTPPSPDPMTWATEPYSTGTSSVSMTATTATDASGVEYYFECTAGGGHSSNWQDSTTYEDTGLSELTQYSYRVKARDKSGNQNETAYSTTKSATTQDGTIPTPNPMTWATEPYATGTSSISMTATTATDASGVEYYFECTAGGGHSSSWQDSTTYQDTGLSELTQYTYRVKARDKSANQNETAYSTTKSATTQDGTAPTPNPMTWATEPYATGTSSISMTATTATDASGVEYYFECTAGGGHSSSWQDSTTYEDTGLSESTQYSYRVKARDKSSNQNETAYSTTKSATTESSSQANLVSWWMLDESSGTTAADSSGNSHDGTLTGGSWAPTSGKFDGAVSLGAANTDRVQVPTTGMSASAATVSLWARIVGTQSGCRYFFGHTSSPPSWASRIQLYMDNGDNQLDLGLGDTHTKTTNITTLSANTWYHIALTWDGTNYVVYVDGVSKASGTYTGLSSLGSYADIGNNGDTTGTYRVEAFQGLLDEVRMYDQALSEYDVADLAGITIASSPSPADEASDVALDADISWSAGYYAADVNGHDVYFGTDFNSVADANHSSAEFKGTQSSTSYDPGTMSATTTYYWAIDEINDTNTWPGDVWSFTTSSGDTTAPSPDPMTWATEPYATGTSSISMIATTATDVSGVEYYFECTAGGGNSSSWQDSTTYTDTGLSELTQYSYRVKARDKSANQNETAYSTTKSATTQDGTAPSPDPMTWATEPYATGTTSISMAATTATDASGVEYYFECTAGGGNSSSWQDSSTYQDTGLSASTQYTYRVKARDKSSNQNETAYSTTRSATTDASAEPNDIDGETSDAAVESDGYVRWSGSTSDCVGGKETDGHDQCIVYVFKLPALQQGETVTEASLKFYYESTSYYTPQGNVDVHGLDYRGSNSVVSGDFYQGSFTGDENSTGIQDDIVTPSTSTGTTNSSSSGDTALKNYLNAQYTGGAEGGDYVFLRLNSDINETNSPQRYYKFSMANHATTSQRPVLTVTIE